MLGDRFVAQHIGTAKSSQEVSKAFPVVSFHSEHPTVACHYWYAAAAWVSRLMSMCDRFNNKARRAAFRKISSSKPKYPRVAVPNTFCIGALVKFEGCGNFKTYASQMAVVASKA